MLESFKDFQALAERQSGMKIKCLRTDHGGEYESKHFVNYCKSLGIVKQLTVPYNPAQNGVAERKNRMLQDAARVMLKSAGVARAYWAEAITTAGCIQNRLPGKATRNRTPYELWHGRKPSIQHLRVFGCIAYSHIPQKRLNNSKLSNRSRLMMMIGYSEQMKAYKLIDPRTLAVEYSRSAVFKEDVFYTQAQTHLNIDSEDNVDDQHITFEDSILDPGGDDDYTESDGDDQWTQPEDDHIAPAPQPASVQRVVSKQNDAAEEEVEPVQDEDQHPLVEEVQQADNRDYAPTAPAQLRRSSRVRNNTYEKPNSPS